jgi:ubiquinone/menaquinone biosynthesis C-methylase UbiE
LRRTLPLILMLAACKSAEKPPEFPEADRPVAPITASRYSTEEARDRVNESGTVMDAVGITPGMTVADIGAGEGYYTIRLAQRVGEKGRVLAQDVIPQVRDTLAGRVTREALDNVSVKLGRPEDPMLPENSFDRIFMVHMYHEITDPYEFLWQMRPSLRPAGRVVVVDAERPTQHHGTPIKLLQCEFAALGYTLVQNTPLRAADGYIAQFEAKGPRPEPGSITVCKG